MFHIFRSNRLIHAGLTHQLPAFVESREVDVAISPKGLVAEVIVVVRLGTRRQSLPFVLHPSLVIDSVEDGQSGEQLLFRQQLGSDPYIFFRITAVEVFLPLSLAENQIIILKFRYSGNPSQAIFPGTRWGIEPSSAVLKDEMAWYPFLGSSLVEELSLQVFSGTTTVRTPTQWSSLASCGVERSNGLIGKVGGLTVVGQEMEISDESILNYRVLKGITQKTRSNVDVHGLFDPAFEDVLSFYHDLCPIPYKTLGVVEINRQMGNFNSGGLLALDPIVLGSNGRRNTVYNNLAHEMAHYYFGGAMKVKDSRLLFLMEGMPEFLTIPVAHEFKVKPKRLMYLFRQDWRRFGRNRKLRTINPLSPLQFSLCRSYPALVFNSWMEEVGRETFLQWVGLLAEVGVRESLLTMSLFLETMHEVFGSKATMFARKI